MLADSQLLGEGFQEVSCMQHCRPGSVRRLTEKVTTVSCNALSLSFDFVPAPVALHEELPDFCSGTCNEAFHILVTDLQGR